MTSGAHQSLLLWILRKMTADGLVVGGREGWIPQGGSWNTLPVPPRLLGVRPDAWGFDPSSEALAIGEAKTWADIDTAHTQEQLGAYRCLIQTCEGRHDRLYVAVPRSAASELDRVLCRVRLLGSRLVVRMHIPDCFVAENRDECA
jgi:hypothetical protein